MGDPVTLGAIALGSSLLSAGSSYFGSKKNEPEPVYPNKKAVNAMATQNRGQLGQARLGAEQNLFSNLAARGFMSGSGLGAAGLSGINRGYLEGLGDMQTRLNIFKHTPMFMSNQQSSGYSAAEGGMDAMSGLLNQGLGFYLMKQMMAGNQNASLTGSIGNFPFGG